MALARQSDTIVNRVVGAGNLIVYQGVRVQAFVGDAEQQLYSDASGAPVAIVETDENGAYQFWIEEGDYTLRFSIGGVALGSAPYSIFGATQLFVSDTAPVTTSAAILFKTTPGSSIATLWVKDAD